MPRRAHTPNRLRVEAALRRFLASGALEIGDRLPPFPELARRFDTSVAVLQAVVPSIVAERILEVVPRVGTFLRLRPQAAVDSAGTGSGSGVGIRFQVNESVEWSSPAWRNLIAAFESAHPDRRVELALSDPGPDPILRRPDVLLTDVQDAFRRLESGGYRPWADITAWHPDERVPYVRDLWLRTGERRLLPILFGCQTLLLAPDAAGIGASASLVSLLTKLPRLPGRLGFVVPDVVEALILAGFGTGAMRTHELEGWLRLVAGCPAPSLVLSCDMATEDAPASAMRLITDGRPQAVLGQLWMSRLAPEGWKTMAPPGDWPVSCGAMCLMIPEDAPQAAHAESLARFIAGPEGQGILAGDALLPTLVSAATSHRHADLLNNHMLRGSSRFWETPCPTAGRILDAARRQILSLRVGRVSIEEALAALLALDR